MNRNRCNLIANAVATRAPWAAQLVHNELKTEERDGKTGWVRELHKLLDWIETGYNPSAAPWRVFAKGNDKLPFVAFSALPGASFCPGAGDCLNWCYSFRAWRYPAAFLRQLQNTVLLGDEAGRAHIAALWADLPEDITVRLYVDGDFRDESDLIFWMDQCHARPDLKVYGYSKSFHVFMGLDAIRYQWPDNYALNLSGGHRHSAEVVDVMRSLPITRGEFVAVSIGRKVKASDHGTPETNAALREAAKAAGLGKVFPCPGKCGTCTKREHACGSRRFDGIPIVIAVH